MTTTGDRAATPGTTVAETFDWVAVLSVAGAEQDAALRRLHGLMVRAAYRQVSRMQGMLGGVGPEVVEEIANQAADEALMALLGKLDTFQGRSRFTTWAYKFAVLQAATAVRAHAWRDREVHLLGFESLLDGDPGPSQYAEAADLATAVRRALDTVLSPHQRRIMVALLLDEVPIDVLAGRLGTNRNALYKTLHDGRQRLRAHLQSTGHLDARDTEAGDR